MRNAYRLLFFVLAASAAASCSPGPSGPAAPQEKLSAVSSLPKPSLPPWISSISPTANAQNLAQIRVIFAKPIAPLAALEGDGAKTVLAHFQLEPALKGRFVLLTPKMVGFVADEALPTATRVQVTMTQGLADLQGDRLTSDLAWTFETASLQLSALPSPGDQATPAPLHPTIAIGSNTALDEASLASHATVSANGSTIAMTAKLEPTPTPPSWMPPNATQQFDASKQGYTYDLTPQQDLKRATHYVLKIAAGVEPARGNVSTTRSYQGSFDTYDPLAVQPTPSPGPTSPPGSRFDRGDPQIGFNNAIDPKTIAGNVTISPQPSPAPRVVALQDNVLAIDPYALDPNAHYTVTVGTGVKDVFGQSLAKPAVLSVDTSNFAPGFWAPSGWSVVPAGAGVNLNFYATNLPKNRYQSNFAPLSIDNVLTQVDPSKVLGDSSGWPVRTLANARANRQGVVPIDVEQQLKSRYGALAYGFTANVGDAPTVTGVVQLTNLGVFAQFFPAQAQILVQHLDDGSPVANATITVYRSPDTAPARCASATTDAGGAARLTLVDLERCYANGSAGEMPSLGVVAAEGGDVANVNVYDYSGIYSYNVMSMWSSGAPSGTGTIFPDRDMYQPGEHGEFTGVAYYTQSGTIAADTNATMTLSLRDPSGSDSKLGTVRTDAYGIFSYAHAFDAAQKLGYYTLTATSDRGYSITGSFRVAEFKPPNFKLDVNLDKTSVQPGGSVQATGTASYLFGAPLSGGKDKVYVTRQYAYLSPKGWDDFSFGRQWFWPEEQPSIATDVLQQTIPFDTSGVAKVGVGVARDLPAPLQYTVEMEASDVSNLSVSNSQTFLALPADGIVGLASSTVGAAKSPMAIRVIVTDSSGKPITGRAVHVELQKMTYVSASQAQAGGASAQESIKYDTVDKADVTPGDSPATVDLTPPDAGSYRVRANFADAQSDASATDLQVFAFGSNGADFGARDTTSVTVTLDKKTYKVGDTATAVIGSPFDKSDVYIAVVRYGAIYQTTLHQVSGSPRVSFRVTPAMFPNAAIEAIVVRRGPKLASVKPGSLDSLVRTGMTPFAIDLKDRYLKVTISPAQAKLAPGASQTVSFDVKNQQGKAVRGKIVAMAVNDAILQLSGYRLPDLVSTIFAQQPIATRFADNRRSITLQTPTAPLEKGFGYGGGFLAGAAGTRVRTNFQPMAYYGTVVTDANGHASVSFKLPDDLTTWRVMAVAIGSDDRHFGTSDATFISQLPLMANALLPQFARPGDRMNLGVSVLAPNPSGNGLDLALQLDGALQFATGNPTQTTLSTTVPSGIQAYRFPVVAGTPAPSTFGARATIGSASDAFKMPLPILDRATTESVVDAGAARGDSNITVDGAHAGTYTISLANSVVPELRPQGEALLGDDSIGTASDLASRVIVASEIGDAAAARANLGALLKLQQDDGGFAYCSFANGSDPFASSYALQALAIAQKRGIAVDARALSRVKSYASARLENPERDKYCKDALCKAQTRFAMLWALAQAGDRRTQFLQQVYDQRDQFGNANQIRLARYLIASPGWNAAGMQYAQHLKQTLYVTGRYANANLGTPWGWREQLVDAQAEMLQLLVETKAPSDQQDGAARALVSQSCKCGWQTAVATAAAIRALDAYSANVPPAAMTVTVASNGTTLGGATFTSAASSKTLTLPSSALHGNTLALHASGGTLHYIVTFTYAVPADSPGNVTAFHVIRELFDPGSAKPIAQIDLTSRTLGMLTGRVFDVGLRIAVDHPVDRVVIEDPLPAGFEAVDGSFATSIQSVVPQSDDWQIGQRQIYHDRVVGFAQHLGPGVYEMHYLVRSVTPGTYRWPGAHVYLEDAPEQFGRSAAATLELKDAP